MAKFADGDFNSIQEIHPFVMQKIAPYEFGIMGNNVMIADAIKNALVEAAQKTDAGEFEWRTLIFYNPSMDESDDDFLDEIAITVYSKNNVPGGYAYSQDVEYAEEGFRYVEVLGYSRHAPFRHEFIVNPDSYPDEVLLGVRDSCETMHSASIINYGKTLGDHKPDLDDDEGDDDWG